MNWIAMDGMKELTKHPDMIVNRHKYFRWTRRTAFLTTMYVVVVPATLGYFGYITEVSCKKRGEVAKLMWDTGQVGDAWEEEGGYDL